MDLDEVIEEKANRVMWILMTLVTSNDEMWVTHPPGNYGCDRDQNEGPNAAIVNLAETALEKLITVTDEEEDGAV